MQPFTGMELNVLTQALAWMGRDCDGFDLLYQVTRYVPSLFERTV